MFATDGIYADVGASRHTDSTKYCIVMRIGGIYDNGSSHGFVGLCVVVAE